MDNKAIAHRALESEISFATGYPGTPSTEIIETIACLNPEILLNGPLPRLVTPRSFTMGYSLWWILFTVMVLDNRTTTMTEHQPHLGTGGSETEEDLMGLRHWSELWG